MYRMFFLGIPSLFLLELFSWWVEAVILLKLNRVSFSVLVLVAVSGGPLGDFLAAWNGIDILIPELFSSIYLSTYVLFLEKLITSEVVLDYTNE